jgi:hypothetical protein
MAFKFHIVDDATVVLREKGVYRQAAVYRLSTRVFAEYRKGQFIALLANEGTSAPNVSWTELDTPLPRDMKDGRIVFTA